MNTVVAEARITDLSRSLSELWDKAEDLDPERNLSRALTQNLIVVTHPALAPELDETIDGMLSRHPCRVVTVVLNDEPTELHADLLAKIRPQGSGRAMILEKLTLTTDPSQFPKLPNLIRPLLVNDITTSLFWATQIPESLGRIAALATMAERTIVDSALFDGDDWRALRQIAHHSLFDLAWLRVAPWRRALAEAFEHFDWEPEEPPTKVVIEHGSTPGSLGAARCLEYWISDKLAADVKLVRAEGEGTPTEPWGLDLTHGPVHIEIRHANTEPQLRVEVTTESRCLLPTFTQASRGSRTDLLAAAVDLRSVMRF